MKDNKTMAHTKLTTPEKQLIMRLIEKELNAAKVEHYDKGIPRIVQQAWADYCDSLSDVFLTMSKIEIDDKQNR